MAESVLGVMITSWISKNQVRDWIFFNQIWSGMQNFDKEFGHVFRAVVYFEPLGGIFAHFDSIDWVLPWNDKSCSYLVTSNIVSNFRYRYWRIFLMDWIKLLQ